ncbi:MAG: rRNA cytosine-C5-methyltransferase [Bacteroidales bacterium]|nr:rRNA cytosine-C5-methyltransferase [Bacteroidales bacterium]
MEGIEDRVLMDILRRAIGPERARVAFDAFSQPPSVSIRLNPSKLRPSQKGHRGSTASLCEAPPLASQCEAPVPPLNVPRVAVVSSPKPFWDGETCKKVPWSEYGRALPERPRFVMDPLFHAGCYYVQDSSAMIVGHILREHLDRLEGLGRPVRALDLCAAPGGKTTDIAASLRERYGDGFQLVSNEVMRNRASILADNVAIWGDPNVVVTSRDPKAFAALEGYFDMIVADVPCSGEGMFRKDPKAVKDWSPEAVDLCSARQRRILADAWPSLREGGLLIYATCTFEEAENDANVEWTAVELGAEVVDYEYSKLPGVIGTRTGGLLVPGFVPGEGQFVAVLEKTSASGSARQGVDILRPLRSGLVKGVSKGRDFIPSPDWALSINPPVGEYPVVELDKDTALRYLHRDGIFVEGQPEGYLIVCFEGHPLGFVKNIGKRWNNLHPLERRIRIDL